MAGNTVVVKPPPTAPLATARVVRRVAEALPPGVLNVVTGEDAEIGEALIRNDDVAKVCFTGSPGGGRRIMEMASGTLTRVALELGGNDPAVILDDALLDEAALGRLFSRIFDSTGQICMAAKRIYVHRSRYDEVVQGLSALLERTVLGHGLDEGTTMGPLHSRQQRDYVAQLVEEAQGQRRGGPGVRRDPGGAGGRQLPPPDPRPGPRSDAAGGHRGAVRPDRPDPPVRRRRGRDRRGERHVGRPVLVGLDRGPGSGPPTVGARLSSGYTWVNNHGAAFLDERAPFGGLRGSGFGREMGIQGLREFMDTHSVSFPVQA